MLLLLFNGGAPNPAIPISAAVITAPVGFHGHLIDRPATSGAWRFVLELGDPAAGDDFTWFDITDFYAGDSYQRGANDYLGRYVAAVAQVQLQTDNDALAPWGQDTTDMFGVNVPLDAGLLMRLGMIRVLSGVVQEWNPIWTGRVETWGDASAARGQIRTHVITVTDTIADLANVPTVIDVGGGVSFEDFLLDDAAWLFGIDSYGDTDVVIPFDLNAVAAITRMDQGADPFGLVWRSRRTGRLISYPAPWDTTNTDRWSNPLLDSYPSGLVFSYSPDFTDIEYIADDDGEPFGVQRTSLGVLNSFTVTTPADLWVEDDPVSIARYGTRPYVATWVASGVEQVVIDLLDARAYSSAQALPLRTTKDHEGFWSALALIDHLDPVTVIHATTDDGDVVTAPGTVRNVTEQRTPRGVDENGVRLLSWQSTVQIDITSTSPAPALLPVEDLTFLGGNSPLLGGPSSAQFSWVNPTQPDITPTEVQLRVLGRSLIWVPKTYPGVGADGVNIGFLSAATTYTLQVRLVRRVGGVVTAFSAIRQVTFTTPAIIIPIFVPDGDSTDVIVGEPPDFNPDDCVLEVELQENDGTGWTTIESYTQSDLTQNADGTWSLIYPVPNSTFVNDRIYRFRSREVCGGIDGQWFTGSSFDPPDDWTDPCVTPPALSAPPYSSSSMIVYIPKVCQGDHIIEAVSGVEGVKGDAFDGFVQMLDQPDRIALLAIDSGWSTTPGPGIIAYGECDQINGVTGPKTIGVYTAIAHNDACVLMECAGMQISVGPGSGTNWIAQATVNTTLGVIGLTSGDIAVGSTGVLLQAEYNAVSGQFILYVNNVSVDTDTIGGAAPTVVVLPIWRVGAPHGSWVTDCAVWNVLLHTAGPTVTINQGSGQTDPAFGSTIVYDVVFSQSVTGFATGDVTLTGTAGATTATVVDSGDHIHYTVNVTGMTTSGGTVTATIAAAVCTGISGGLPNTPSTSTDNTVQWGVLYTDDFNRADNTVISDGSHPWIEGTGGSGSLSIVSNTLTCLTTSSQSAFWDADLTASQFIEFDVLALSSGGVYLCLRAATATNPGTFYRMFYSTSGGGTLGTDKVVSGVETRINTTTGVGTPSFTYRLRFEISGSTLNGYINGVLKATFTDSAIASGGFAGVRLDGTGGANKVDNMTCGSL